MPSWSQMVTCSNLFWLNIIKDIHVSRQQHFSEVLKFSILLASSCCLQYTLLCKNFNVLTVTVMIYLFSNLFDKLYQTSITYINIYRFLFRCLWFIDLNFFCSQLTFFLYLLTFRWKNRFLWLDLDMNMMMHGLPTLTYSRNLLTLAGYNFLLLII